MVHDLKEAVGRLSSTEICRITAREIAVIFEIVKICPYIHQRIESVGGRKDVFGLSIWTPATTTVFARGLA